MQTTSTQFENYATGQMRPLSWQLRISFTKEFDDSVDFFVLNSSLLDGPDVLAPEDANVIQQWDKYAYGDYSDRVMQLEVTQEEIEPFSIVQSFADITLNNYDGYFTPHFGSPIDQYILPRRPIRIFMGFGNENLPQFVGLTDSMPELDKTSGTIKFHAVDFMTYLFDQEVGDTEMLFDVSTGDALDFLFQQAGLLPGQYVLDDTSFNRISFFFVEKGDKLGPIIQELMEAEQGRLYMDELGIIRFLNRQNYNSSPVYSFNFSNTIDYINSTEDDIINSVKITCDTLRVQDSQSIWELAERTYIPAGGSVDVWASTDDPITGITLPSYSETQVESSHFITTTDPDGLVPYIDVSVTSYAVFAKAVKLTFTNNGSDNAYIQAIDLWGTPVRVVETVLVEDSDQTSIDDFEERPYELHTKYIQDPDSAVTKASIMIDDYKDYGAILDVDVKGSPALQIGDIVTAHLDGYNGNFTIVKIVSVMGGSKFQQRLKIKAKDPRLFFILNSSLLDGPDVLAP